MKFLLAILAVAIAGPVAANDEVTLRGYVERQVDCIAGFLFWGQGSRPHC